MTVRYTRKEAAAYCGVSVITIDRALARKEIAHFRIGKRVVFDRRHLDEFLANNECRPRRFNSTLQK